MINRFRKLIPLLAVLLLSACGDGSEDQDQCHRDLNAERFDAVLENCDNPYQRASAWLGKAGFDLFALLLGDAASAGYLVPLLGATEANISTKRELINNAIEEVADPGGGDEAFALLTASYLGLALSTTEFLDNGAEDSVALDGAFDDAESNDATGFFAQTPYFLTGAQQASPAAYFSVVASGTAYLLDCAADTTTPYCDDDPADSVEIYLDSEADGILLSSDTALTGSDRTDALAAVGSASSANLVVQFTGLILPFYLLDDRGPRMQAFLGEGDVTNGFSIGLGRYLALMTLADATLSLANGVATDDAPLSIIISDFRTSLDNGATCLADDATFAYVVDILNSLYALYVVSAGTEQNADPGSVTGAYLDYNVVSEADMAGMVDFIPSLPVGADYPFGVDFGYRFIYPTSDDLLLMDTSQATATVDGSTTSFIGEFEGIAVFAPNASTALDGVIGVMELFCLN
mgnify:CR=1 FL=1